MQLTDKQQAVYDFIADFKRKLSYAPSTRDIQLHFGFRSQTAAVNHLKALIDKGYVKRHTKKARSLILLK